jgi:hypothetical protein
MLIFFGPIVPKDIINENACTNFMALYVAMIKLLNPDYGCYLNYNS